MDTDGIVGSSRSVSPGVDRPCRCSTAGSGSRRATVLEGRVTALAPVVGVRPTSVSVRDQQTRWGSASKQGSLSFSWRLLLAPAFVLDAVVVHELAHLRHANHGAAFWALARSHAPRTDEARRWLRAVLGWSCAQPSTDGPGESYGTRLGLGLASGGRSGRRGAAADPCLEVVDRLAQRPVTDRLTLLGSDIDVGGRPDVLDREGQVGDRETQGAQPGAHPDTGRAGASAS